MPLNSNVIVDVERSDESGMAKALWAVLFCLLGILGSVGYAAWRVWP